MWRLAAVCLALAGCATLPPPPTATASDCAVLMLAAGFIAEHQPLMRMRPQTRDIDALLWGRAPVEPPEVWSPDAGARAKAAIAYERWLRRAPASIACPLEKTPFVAWRPGRPELVLSTPAVSRDGAFAVVDAAVFLPGRRVDHYRFMLSGPPDGAWDLHRITFASAPLR